MNFKVKLPIEDKIILYMFVALIGAVVIFFLAKPIIIYLGLCTTLVKYCKILSGLFFNSFIYLMLYAGIIFALLRLVLGNVKKYRYINMFTPYTFDNDKLNKIISGFNRKIKIYVIKNKQPVAFSAGILKKNQALYLSKGTIKNLDEPKLNAIIQHEIAHIINNDILHLTIVQFASDMFFYMPFLKAIYYRLKTKKEYFADSYAALKSGDKNFVIDALLRFSQLKLTHSSAIAFADNNTDVLKRIKRLEGKNIHNKPNKSLLIITIVSALIVVVFTINAGATIASNINCPMHQPVSKVMHR